MFLTSSEKAWKLVNEEDATRQVSGRSPEDIVQSSLELHLRRPDGTVTVLPFHRANLECEGVRFSYHNGEVHFKTEETVYKEGHPVQQGRLEVGSSLEVGGSRLLLWDHGRPAAYLKGYSPPYSGDIWPLGEGRHQVGRAGRRQNQIQLDHPTVSREHATLYSENGRYRLLAESATNPVWVGGSTVEPGQSVELAPGDLIEIGELVFRFQNPENAPENTGLIQVRSLGTMQARVGDTPIADKDWKTQQIKWLFAHLAYQWGRPLGIDGLIEELWPDFSIDKGRNNLNYSLSRLRTTLREALPETSRSQDAVLRSSSTLQLNPDLLDQHDVVVVQRSLEAIEKNKERWEESAETAVLSYTGPFLTDCYLDWVQPIRQSLELAVLDAAQELMQARAAREAWKDVVPVATHALKIDACSSWATLYLMQGLRHTKSPADALRVFEQHKKTLHRELGAEPSVEVIKEQLIASSLL